MAAQDQDRYTRWSILGAGEGGGRIASQYFGVAQRAAVGQRILLLNTNVADLQNVLEELKQHLTDERGIKRLEEIRENHILKFGEDRGTGNDFLVGAEYAAGDYETTIRRRIMDSGVGTGDALVSIATLGGGTGCGSVPWLIERMKHDPTGGLDKLYHFAIGVWPFREEPGQRHFNAACGLSRLLMDKDGKQNAHMVVLCDNARVSDQSLPPEAGHHSDYHTVNRLIVKGLDLMAAPGRRAMNVIDTTDYVRLASRTGMYHFTPALSLENDIEEMELEFALDDALDKVFLPVDPKSSLIAYLIVEVPKDYVGKYQFTENKVDSVFQQWAQERMQVELGMSSICIKEAKDNKFNVGLLLGGFDLRQFLDKEKVRIERARHLLTSNEEDEEKLAAYEAARKNLEAYMDRRDRTVAQLGGEYA
jgi:tubulin-like protein CetZ